ncbi:MAG TPA: NlpC/P60 family protein [Mucilaginibacter sp.]|nr:NlpC/P60 family protein [Mucilaginibacter sp.]
MHPKPLFCSFSLVFVLLFSGLAARAQTIPLNNNSGAPLTSQDDIIAKYARLMDVPKDNIVNIRLYNLIEQYSATPYKLGGNDENGVDCSGFSCIIEKQIFGITIPRTTTLQAGAIKIKNVSDLEEGDLIFLKLGGTKINHVGVYLQNGYFVHATSNLGIVLDNLDDPDTQERFMSCGSIK